MLYNFTIKRSNLRRKSVRKYRQIRNDEYLDYLIPKWYWIIMLSILGAGTIAFISGAIYVLLTDRIFLDDINTTMFEQGSVIAYCAALITAGLLILGVIIFPVKVKPKNDPNYKKLWPPWSH